MCLYPYAIEVYKEEKFKRKELIKVIYQLDKYFENWKKIGEILEN